MGRRRTSALSTTPRRNELRHNALANAVDDLVRSARDTVQELDDAVAGTLSLLRACRAVGVRIAENRSEDELVSSALVEKFEELLREMRSSAAAVGTAARRLAGCSSAAEKLPDELEPEADRFPLSITQATLHSVETQLGASALALSEDIQSCRWIYLSAAEGHGGTTLAAVLRMWEVEAEQTEAKLRARDQLYKETWLMGAREASRTLFA